MSLRSGQGWLPTWLVVPEPSSTCWTWMGSEWMDMDVYIFKGCRPCRRPRKNGQVGKFVFRFCWFCATAVRPFISGFSIFRVLSLPGGPRDRKESHGKFEQQGAMVWIPTVLNYILRILYHTEFLLLSFILWYFLGTDSFLLNPKVKEWTPAEIFRIGNVS